MTNFAIIDPGGDDLPTEMRQLVGTCEDTGYNYYSAI